MTRLTIQNVMQPGKTYTVDATKYDAMRRVVMRVLTKRSPGMTYDELAGAVKPALPQDVFPGGARAGWWLKAVQLDLEAKGVIAREATRPLRWRRV